MDIFLFLDKNKIKFLKNSTNANLKIFIKMFIKKFIEIKLQKNKKIDIIFKEMMSVKLILSKIFKN
jgi:hypothetical protein